MNRLAAGPGSLVLKGISDFQTSFNLLYPCKTATIVLKQHSEFTPLRFYCLWETNPHFHWFWKFFHPSLNTAPSLTQLAGSTQSKKAFHIGYPVDGHVNTKILRCMNNQNFLPILLRTLRARESSAKKHLKKWIKGVKRLKGESYFPLRRLSCYSWHSFSWLNSRGKQGVSSVLCRPTVEQAVLPTHH